MSLHFRAATRADVPAIVAMLADDVLGRSRENADPARYLAAFDAMERETGNGLYVGEKGGAVIACYQLTIISGLSLSATRRALLESVRVASDQRGGGIGAALMADAESRARAAGCGLLQFTSNRARSDAHRFYEGLGFTPSHIGYKKQLQASDPSQP